MFIFILFYFILLDFIYRGSLFSIFHNTNLP